MTEPRLIKDDDHLHGGYGYQQVTESWPRNPRRAEMIRRSALWAAYGDALGWISELTDEKGLMRRTLGAPLRQPVGWKRRIGGRAGVTVDLPAGCYSDDSQLRLATCRCIRPDGFDVEAFSKVELPVWLSYAFGGGRSSTAAAANLARPRVQWFANTYKGWTDSGGNGAAMRIQPHVWAAPAPEDPVSYLRDVVRNTICTHSHPYGILGAVLHSLALARAMTTGRNPSPEDLIDDTRLAANLLELVQDDMEISQFWRPALERESGPFAEKWAETIQECQDTISAVSGTANREGAERYEAIVDLLQLRDPKRRGNGVLTALAAVALTWCEPEPERALRIAANAVGTDTDTIATMAGAILGVNAESAPPASVLDADLFQLEADRLSAIAEGGKPQSHRYPDLLRWSPPKTQADALASPKDGGFHLAGLGRAEALGEPLGSPNQGFMWQWMKLDFGQTMLVKRRRVMPEPVQPPAPQAGPRPGSASSAPHGGSAQTGPNAQPRNETTGRGSPEVDGKRVVTQAELEAMIDHLRSHRDEDRVVGQVIRRVVNKCSPGQMGAFLAAAIECLKETPPGKGEG